jgi:hypothetical protein
VTRAAETISDALGRGAHVSLTIGSVIDPHATGTSSTIAQALDGAQLREAAGPSVSCALSGVTVVAAGPEELSRWPRFASHLPTDIGRVVAVPIPDVGSTQGALTVYLTGHEIVNDWTVGAVETLAAAVAAMWHEQGLRAQLDSLSADMHTALASREIIDQAKGIVMAGKHCTADEAFHHLVELSSTTHMKLRDLARNIVEQTSGARLPSRD